MHSFITPRRSVAVVAVGLTALLGITACSSPQPGAASGDSVDLSLQIWDPAQTAGVQKAVDAFEAAYFSTLLRRSGGNVSEAARQAGLDRSNFRRAARRAGIKTRDDG